MGNCMQSFTILARDSCCGLMMVQCIGVFAHVFMNDTVHNILPKFVHKQPVKKVF